MTRFEVWLRDAQVGDKILYMQSDHASRNPEVQQLFMKAAEDGLVFLYQKRVRFGVFNYYAKRLSEQAGKKLKPWEW